MLRWTRRFPNSANNFDLVLANPQELDRERMSTLVDGILEERHRRLTLSSRAVSEFRRWFQQPDTPLKSEAYVLLSNWFMTQSGDRHSTVASRCEHLWDALFLCRPPERLSSPEAGRNHVVILGGFDNFWRRLAQAQGDGLDEVDGRRGGNRALGGPVPLPPVAAPKAGPPAPPLPVVPEVSETAGSTGNRLRAELEKDGVHCVVEGSPRALADFLKLVSNWKCEQAG